MSSYEIFILWTFQPNFEGYISADVQLSAVVFAIKKSDSRKKNNFGTR